MTWCFDEAHMFPASLLNSYDCRYTSMKKQISTNATSNATYHNYGCVYLNVPEKYKGIFVVLLFNFFVSTTTMLQNMLEKYERSYCGTAANLCVFTATMLQRVPRIFGLHFCGIMVHLFFTITWITSMNPLQPPRAGKAAWPLPLQLKPKSKKNNHDLGLEPFSKPWLSLKIHQYG